ncbi:zinc finger protein, putative [Plasmodium berghei]|uniref:Zinc finger protein, putative n=2 Tax=Plasmodium berghei TaxID=5821 RepID=A0A509AMJ9_PLABA|nr:zinc finger protein, putative [Plasmodium berghei ANKA]CXI67501.1 zinc finger protein, putative [Plasmodium berghei]SCN26940.1 zinc finger protein, putative [Plasmodium berghei]SCO61381.1 zinc finger protein, putative [Plasmodium berghei]SCO63361.1 zinc finger protein, putative [Plasmodium berghei]VUC56770.1 zinc finger protein, putative [Plasmodium berghei ANKA]|eukprot:XP_034422556.1 zinc finger protein, putative [Plasmodium berghei ANKA]
MKMSVTLRQHFWKTKLCPLHAENKCKEGDNCDYAHSIEDLRSIPDLKRTKLCYKLLKGEKCFNKKCNYAHNQDELKSAQNLFAYKSSMCKFIENKACLNGSTCRFAHNIDELRVPRIPEILLEKGSTEIDGKNVASYYLDDNNNNTNDKINNEMIASGESNIENCYKIGNMHNNGNINKEANINCNITGNNNCNMYINRNNNNICSMDVNRNNYQRINSDRNSNNGNFNNNFNMLLNNFNAMHIKTNGEHIYNNQIFLNKYNNNNNNINNNYHMYKNNAMNSKRDDRKRKDKNINKNKEKQIKQKKNNHNKNYENYDNTEDNVINNHAAQSIKQKEEGNEFYDSSTTISSSLNFEEESDKNKINEAYVSNNFEEVDINQYCEKIEENTFIESNENINDHYNDRSTYENCNKVAYSNDKEKSLSKKKKKKNMNKNSNEDNKKNSKNCINNNEQCINELEGQYNYMDYNNYNYLNHLFYNKMMQMKFNPSIQYMNYQQINNIEGQNNALMSNNYSKFIKPNEYGLYDHQNNMPYMVAPNYYPHYLYYYTNPCNYNQSVIPDKIINNNNDKNINDESPLKKNNPTTSDTEICQSDHDDNEEEEIVVNQINFEKDEESEETNCEKEKLTNNDKIYDGIDDKINEEETNKNDIDKNHKSKSDVNIDNSITELTNKRDCIEKENKYSFIKKSTHSNNNDNIIRIEDKLNDQKGENVYDETAKLQIIKNQKTEKHRHQKTKRSKLVPLNKNGKKKFNKELHMNKDEHFNKQKEGNMETEKLVNDNVLNEQNRNCIKTQSASSSVYSYMVNTNNMQNMSYDKNFINPPVPSIEMYHNNPCHMNELTNEQMIYNLNNRNIGYYYYPYMPTTYNDEVYLN